MPGLKVEETSESKAGRAWTGAGGEEMPKLGAIHMNWRSSDGRDKTLNFKAGKVGRPLVSVAKLIDAGFEVILTRKASFIKNQSTGERFNLVREGGMFVLKMWVRVQSFTRP